MFRGTRKFETPFSCREKKVNLIFRQLLFRANQANRVHLDLLVYKVWQALKVTMADQDHLVNLVFLAVPDRQVQQVREVILVLLVHLAPRYDIYFPKMEVTLISFHSLN